MNSIINGLAIPAGTIIDGAGYPLSANNFLPFTNGLTKTGGDPNAPKAYLNWAVFNRDYIQNVAKSGFKRVTTNSREDGTDVNHEWLKPDSEIVIDEPGFIYIWLSNESESPIEVYFDDFKVTHTKSPVIQQEEYYPFGLTFNLYSRESSTDQDFKFNGKEEQDELGLNWLDYGWRMYDPAIARWSAVDNLAEKYNSLSPYHYAGNNLVRNIDIDGNEFTESGKKWAKKLWSAISDKISANNEKMSKKMAALESGYDKNGKALSDRKADRYARQVNRLQENNNALAGVANEIIALDNSTQVYNVVESSSLDESGPISGTGNKVAATSFN